MYNMWYIEMKYVQKISLTKKITDRTEYDRIEIFDAAGKCAHKITLKQAECK